jgi:hypothetical protein
MMHVRSRTGVAEERRLSDYHEEVTDCCQGYKFGRSHGSACNTAGRGEETGSPENRLTTKGPYMVDDG